MASLGAVALRQVKEKGREGLAKSFRKYWYLIATTIGFSLVAAVFEAFSITMLIPFLQSLGEDASTFATGYEWIDRWVLATEAPQEERVLRICGFILFAAWMRSLFGYLSSFYGMKSRAMIVEDLRMRIVDQLQAVSLSFFSSTRTGEIINTLTNELQRVSHALNVVVTVVTQSFLLVAYVGLMVSISWELSLIVLVFFGFLAFALTYLIRRVRRSGQKVTKANGAFTASASEFIGGIRTITAFNAKSFERSRLQAATNRLADAIIETSQRGLAVQPLSQAVVSTVLVGVVLVATQYVLAGQLDVALLLTYLFALFRLMPVVHNLNNQRGQWAQQRAAITNVSSLLQTQGKPYLDDGTRELDGFRDALVFENVSFAYEEGEPVIRDVDLRIVRGQMTAIVGASGAGKSTLVDLIPRFYDPSEGRLLIDGVDLRAFTLHSLRERVGVVSQDTYIFNASVRDNIAYGLDDVSEEAVRRVARQANALEFIEEMPEGFATVLGERGVRLSGGQRQRLAIARALLRDPEILILDEATSALDSVSEKLVQQSLEELMEGRTVIAIAHRLSTVENADQVVVLEEGRIVEQGRYDELLERKGQLWEYHSIQFQLA